MMDEEARKLKAQQREFPETMEILGRVRDALAAQVFVTAVKDREVREDLFTRVQAIDALRTEMGRILKTAGDQQVIDNYAKSVATTGQ